MSDNTLATVEADDLSLSEDNRLNQKQLALLMRKTPDKYIKHRPAKGGGTWATVTGGYMKKVLNLMFGWDWDFEIVSESIYGTQVIVKGRLTCRNSDGKQIVKMQYGRKDIMLRKADAAGVREYLDIGNDFKSAATDALKKCASEIGIAADIYNSNEFRELSVVDSSTNANTEEYNSKSPITPSEQDFNYDVLNLPL